MTPAFHRRVRAGFLEIARAEPDRCAVVDARGTIDQVQARVRKALAPLLGVAARRAPSRG
jgi:dTMP kinase